MQLTEEDVARLAQAWTPFSSVVEAELMAGWTGAEPPKLVYRVKTYLLEHDPKKAKQFEDRFFRHFY